MIERYTLPEMGRVWSEAHKYELWCRVETLVLEAHARGGHGPGRTAWRRSAPRRRRRPEAVAAIEAVTGHDVIAFLSAWADNTVPREAAAYVHFGMTSSDLLDTALALQLTEATDLLLARCAALTAALRDHALAHRGTLRVGRTHGIHAEPDVWGHRVADFAFAHGALPRRGCAGPARPWRSASCPARSGPTPTSTRPSRRASWPSSGCGPPTSPTQVVLRDGIAEWVSVLALISTVCEAIALEVRHGQRTEVAELAEPFGAGQKGSSAMPHKKNPVRSERICGLARIVRAQIVPVLEGIPLWHERDISHSSTERVALPDAAIGTDYLLEQTTGLVSGLVVDAERMRANLDATGGLIYTSAVLLELVEAGMSREDAYALVQAAAMDTWQTGSPFRETLREHAAERGQPLDEARLDEACRPERYVAAARRGLRAARAPVMTRPGQARPDAEAPVLGQGPRALRGRRRRAAAGGQRPDLRLRLRARHRDPGQGQDPDPAVAVVVRAQLADLVPNHWWTLRSRPSSPAGRWPAGRCDGPGSNASPAAT